MYYEHKNDILCSSVSLPIKPPSQRDAVAFFATFNQKKILTSRNVVDDNYLVIN